jgi:long-chain fatty acid transport protein
MRRLAMIVMTGSLAVLSSASMAQDRPPGDPPQPSQFLPVVFNFAPPGARSLGMGGSFIAIADDATASESNPAGLTILSRPEVSVHGRYSSFNVEADDIEAASMVNFIDVIRDEARQAFPNAGIPDFAPPSTNTRFDDSETSLSFASLVKPFNRWSISIYYLESINFSGASDFRVDDDVFVDFWRSRIDASTSLRSLGASAAFKIGDRVSLGLSARSSELSIDTFREQRVDYFNDIEFDTGNLDHIDFVDFQQRTNDSDRAITFNAGLLLNPNGKVSLGLVYKEGGKFTVDVSEVVVLCVDAPTAGFACNPDVRTGNGFGRVEGTRETEFELPDVIGLGLAWRPVERLTIAADVNRIHYSNLNPQIDPEAGFPAGVLEEIEDETDVHLGAEYTLLAGGGQPPVLLRAGVYTDPDHEVFGRVDSGQTHVTVGLGTVFQRNLQVDVAADLADTADTTLLSFVYRF